MAEGAGTGLFLEDLAVGNLFESRDQLVSEADIIAFATQFDPQPFHLDPEAAKDSFFQGLAASGWHTMGITMRLIVESVPLARGIIGAGGEVAWPRPTRPGDVLRVRSEIVSIAPSKSRPDRAIVTTHSLTLGQDDQIRQDFTAKLLVFSSGAD